VRSALTYLLLLLVAASLRGQHFQFSQFYAAPTYLNPAFTGANACGRFTLNYRNQWAGIPGVFNTYQASLDHYMKNIKSGIGLQLLRDQAGLGSLTTTQINLLYAYEARINKKLMTRAGFSVGSIQRKMDLSAFTFEDQLEEGTPTSLESFSDASVTYVDIGTGLLMYTRFSWLGISLSHINKPNQSFMNGVSPLPTELKFHGGYKFVIEDLESSAKRLPETNFITLAWNYKKQNKFNQMDIGIYYNKNIFVVGCWYRGLPFFKPEVTYANNDAIILLAGINIDRYKMGYSYDITISKLTHFSTRGTHELSMSYMFCKFKRSKKKKNMLISCPKF
jgi:type IX secretion system PorP/SprF family membrane protein